MKYSDLISFKPIESTIQLVEGTKTKNEVQNLVQTYVMSDNMAESLQAPVIDQLQMDEVVDNKGVFIVGNYGTGKSHLMSVISAVANDADNLQYLQNQNFAKRMEPVAGKFEILRLEIGGVTMTLYDILFDYIEEDLQRRGIDFKKPDYDTVRDVKQVIRQMMEAFCAKYPCKGYLIVVDEFLAYLTSRDERQLVLDLEVLRAFGEMCSKSNLRIILGIQEKIFDNPRFSFVSESLKHVSDRFTQMEITKEDTEYVVSERILKKNSEQKAVIRNHLEKFSSLYNGMSARMDEFVNLFPIHPAYIDVFNKVYLVENRHILKNISKVIKDIFDKDVPEDAPGIYSFDTYWPAIKGNGLLKSDLTISKVVNASSQLEEIINRSFPHKVYKNLAIQIIYALSVHRLTTNGLDVQFGLTAENLKDDLCLYLDSMPENDADFLLGVVNATLKDIMTTVSGQFIIHSDANNQYYIDVDKIVDYDEKIKQKASLLAPAELNRYFYTIVYNCLEWDAKEYVTNFKIYEYDLNWNSHNIFREGYLFMGLPGERSTAQPERDFYIHIMPPYANDDVKIDNLQDEVYFIFRSSEEFKQNLGLYAAANQLADISEGKDREAYLNKAKIYSRQLMKYLSNNKNTCFNVRYSSQVRQLIEVLKGNYKPDLTFKDTIDLAASICLDEYFNSKYPDFPVMETKVTRKNIATLARDSFDYFAGRKTKQARMMLKSFGVLEDDKITPEHSKYANYYIDLLKNLLPQRVLNYTDLFEEQFMAQYIDKHFKISFSLTPIIFLSMVYAGYAVITLNDGKKLSASNLDEVPKINVMDLYEFKYISRPAKMAVAEIKALFKELDLNPALLDMPKDRDSAVKELCQKAQSLSNDAVTGRRKTSENFELWGEPLADSEMQIKMMSACDKIKAEFSNYGVKYNTYAKLNNFHHTMEEIQEIGKQIWIMQRIPEYLDFKNECSDIVNYISTVQNAGATELKQRIDNARTIFRAARDSIADGISGLDAARKVKEALDPVKKEYIDIYYEAHKKKRLGIEEAKEKRKIQESIQLKNLNKLHDLTILPGAKLTELETSMANIQICYELTPTELNNSPFCRHCNFRLDKDEPNVNGRLGQIKDGINKLIKEWTKKLLDTVNDPIVLAQKEYLSVDQQKVIADFIKSKELPKRVDDFFVDSITALLKGFDPVVIDAHALVEKLEKLQPLSEADFRKKLNEIILEYIKGKDANKLRIVVKRKES
jgi:hypothetical protein